MIVRTNISSIFKRITLGFASFALVLGSVVGVVPLFLTEQASALGSVAFNSMPSVLPPSFSSLGYQATSTTEFGDYVQLSGSDRKLNSISLSLTDWACENDAKLVGGVWVADRAAGVPCVTTEGSSYSHPVTLNVYNVDKSGSVPVVGSRITTVTLNVAVPFRPSHDETNCPDSDKWYDAAAKSCQSGKAFVVDFNMSASGTVLPTDIIVAVAYNTQSYGIAPTGQPGPYTSLNVSLASPTPSIGTNVDTDVMFWNTTYPGYTSGLKADTGWPYTLAMTINVSPADSTLPVALITSPSGAVSGTTLTIKGNVTDETALNYYYCYVTLPGSSEVGVRGADCNTTWGAANGTLGTVNLADVDDGNYEAHVVAYDKAGNHSNLNYFVPFVLDNTAPSAPAGGLPNGTSQKTKEFDFSWGDSSDLNSPITYEFQSSLNNTNVDGVLTAGLWKSAILTNPTIHSTGAADGTWFWQVRAMDAAGNKSAWSSIWNVTLDSVAPTVSLASTVVSKTNGDKVVTLEGQATDSAFNYYYCFVTDAQGEVGSRDSLCQTAWALGIPFQAVFTPTLNGQSGGILGKVTLPGTLPSGVYTAHVIAKDKVGNSTESTKAFTVDNQAPDASINTIASDSTQPVISGTLSETDIDTFTVKLDGKPLDSTRSSENWAAKLATPLAYGSHTVLVEGADLAGNTFNKTQQFTIVAPVIPATPVAIPPTAATPVSTVATVAPAPLPQNVAAQSATPVATTDTTTIPEAEVLGASTTKKDATDVAGVSTTKADVSKTDSKDELSAAWWWLLTIPAAGAWWWAVAAFRRRNS